MPEIEDHPLSTTSCLNDTTGRWQTAIEYEQSGLMVSPAGFASATDVLLTQPNLNSSHLFRADILHDSTKRLKTPAELERDHSFSTTTEGYDGDVPSKTPETFPSFILTRTVVRKLIPRNPRLDEKLVQSCHTYKAGTTRNLVVYQPHADSAEATPWYHPPVRALAYLYEASSSNDKEPPNASISIHVLQFETSLPGSSIPTRLHRTLLSLLHTLIRLSKNMSRRSGSTMNFAIAPKDNIVPQHIVQNTYSRLKHTYSADLMKGWVEKTEPSKHVFEDLSIAAFLIELWRQMYGVFPASEKSTTTISKPFPGFVDVACGNGILVYVLRTEGYEGWGFDARRRRTWEVLPGEVQKYLLERVLVPEPYLRAMLQPTDQRNTDAEYHQQLNHALTGLEYHDGIFKAGTFIISNHADELTPWTPILAAISHPTDPLPWLAIPCCSHALSGAKYRYPVPKPTLQPENHTSTRTLAGTTASCPPDSTMSKNLKSVDGLNNGKQCRQPPDTSITCTEEDEQPASGDLKALRVAKAQAVSGVDQTSMYACLTAKVIALAEELDIETERTLMRIPSTRNIGVIGGRRRALRRLCSRSGTQGGKFEERLATERLQNGVWETDLNSEALASNLGDATGFDKAPDEDSGKVVRLENTVLSRIDELIERECKQSGGVAAAAQLWVERAKSLQIGQGRGKLNAGKAHG